VNADERRRGAVAGEADIDAAASGFSFRAFAARLAVVWGIAFASPVLLGFILWKLVHVLASFVVALTELERCAAREMGRTRKLSADAFS